MKHRLFIENNKNIKPGLVENKSSYFLLKINSISYV